MNVLARKYGCTLGKNQRKVSVGNMEYGEPTRISTARDMPIPEIVTD
ncbi:MAG: hypothetical protein AAFY76_05390 [Cyanobacteria bacterium J06649_11]|nr:hypothetical protein [Rivularia sp. ALOHA_DT_140]